MMNGATNGGGPIIPDYAGPNVRGIIPALLGPAPWETGLPSWFPSPVRFAERGRAARPRRTRLGPVRRLPPPDAVAGDADGRSIHTVAPTTTATALSSIATGLTPAEHGLIGYRMVLGGEVINVLRWMVGEQPVRRSHPPRDVQPYEPFLGHAVPVVSPSSCRVRDSPKPTCAGPSRRAGAPPRRSPSRRRRSSRRGSGSCTATTAASTRSPTSAASARTTRQNFVSPTTSSTRSWPHCHPTRRLLVTADHGQVDVGENIVHPSPALLSGVSFQSGRGPIPLAARRAGSDPVDRRDRHRGDRPPGPRGHEGADARRALVRSVDGPSDPCAARRRRARRPSADQLLRSGRLGTLRAGVSSRGVDVGGGQRSPARHRV